MLKKNKQLVIAVLVVLVAIFWFLQSSRQQEITELDSEHQTVEQKLKTQNTANKKIQAKSITSQKQSRQENLSLKEEFLNSNYFSEDPRLNIEIVSTKYAMCILLLDTEHQNFLAEHNSEVQQDYFDAFHDYCDSVAADHPEFLLKNKYLLFKLEKEIRSASDLLISKAGLYEIDSSNLESVYQLVREIKQTPILFTNPNILNSLYFFHFKHSTTQLSKLLSTEDFDYIAYISQQAQTLYSCEHSQQCGPFSSYMMELCMLNEQACGLTDYSEYIEKKFTQGVQADIKIAYNYIETLFDSL